MEKLRKFERGCLRICLGKHRDTNSDLRKYISNSGIYNLANIPRFDVFVLGLIRNHIARARRDHPNPLIIKPFEKRDNELLKIIAEGYLSPETSQF